MGTCIRNGGNVFYFLDIIYYSMNAVFLKYGNDIIDTYDLIQKRRICNVYFQQWFQDLSTLFGTNHNLKEDIEHYCQTNLTEILKSIDVPDYDNLISKLKCSVVIRNAINNQYKIDWHMDNHIPQRHLLEMEAQLHDLHIIGSDDKYVYSLWNNGVVPKYTIIIYFTSYGIHFHGGELELLHGRVIYPKCGDVVFFDSREIHRVRSLRNGIRQCIVIKLV
jgi:hypothetical protein